MSVVEEYIGNRAQSAAVEDNSSSTLNQAKWHGGIMQRLYNTDYSMAANGASSTVMQ